MKYRFVFLLVLCVFGYTCYGQVLSEKEYAQLSQLFAADVLLKEDAAKSFAAYKSQRSLNVYSHK
ncbi:MAG: hypothetical protein K2O53_07070, partial [Bacteroidales bacterium]|nr:hypothetical protein [Bacteroidales bacterium]